VLEPPLVARNISNRERGGPLERTLSLEEPSPTTIACLKIEFACAFCNAIDTLYLQNVRKIERERPPIPFAFHVMLTSMKKHSPSDVDIRKISHLEEETYLLKINCDKNHPSL
jgi:hypothetical protein